MKSSKKISRSLIFGISGTAALIVLGVICLFIDKRIAYAAFALALAYAALIVIVYTVRGRNVSDAEISGFSGVISDMITQSDSPVMIVNSSNKIVWSNERFDDLAEVKEQHISYGAAKLFGGILSYANLNSAMESETEYIDVETKGSQYKIKVFPLNFNRQSYYGTIWYSRDTELSLIKEVKDSSARVAYIVIDNTNEVSQEIQENQRFGSATVNKLLSDWAAEYNAILIEYDRDKYVMQFENKYLKEMTDSKFDILDKVVESTMNESNVPITISIGVSSETGTLSEKRESAQDALRSALQRGGALAVVKTANGEDSFGGRTKAVQRQTKIRSRLCKDLLCDLIPKCSNVIIFGHLRPDFDSIASNIGISKLVAAFGKPFYIVADRSDPQISDIIDEVADFPEYENVFVDAAYAQEQLAPSTLVIITDVSNPLLFAAPGVYDNASHVVIIDHHAIKGALGKQVCQQSNIDPTASSASELVCEILELYMRPGDIRPEEAQILLAGILLDTQFFAHDTGTRTYSACIFLRNAGADVGKAKIYFKSDFDQFKLVNVIGSNVELYRGCIAIARYDGGVNPENKVTASKVADRLVEVRDVNASFVLYTMDDGINLSARSDGSINVINIASVFGGGGHFQSAGALIRQPGEDGKLGMVVTDITEAYELLKEAIDKYLDGDKKEGLK